MRVLARVAVLAAAATALAPGAFADYSLPSDRGTAWNPGLAAVGGIPARSAVCATIDAAAYGNGASDAAAAIQAALDACPAGQVVKLSAGTFTVNNFLLIHSAITLRGAGPKATVLRKTNGARPRTTQLVSGTTSIYNAVDPGSYTYDAQPVVIVGPNRWPGPDNATSQSLAADGAKGATSVTVADASGFAAGQFVLLDERSGASWQPTPAGFPGGAQVWAGDRVAWNMHLPQQQFADDNGASNAQGPYDTTPGVPPAAMSWFSRTDRPTSEIKEIASVSGAAITFTTPLHISYRISHAAQLTRYTANDPAHGNSVHVKNAGVEDLSVQGGADGQIRFEAAAYSWAKNVENTQWIGEGFAVNNSFRVEIRDSYIHTGSWPQPGGAGYAISFAGGTSEVLVENNVIRDTCKDMVVRSCGAGSVFAYNYADDPWDQDNPAWVEVGLNASHMAGPHHVLFEGNYSPNADSDFTHGNAIYLTFFRNQLTGKRASFPDLSRTAGLAYGSWWDTFVGNVLGRQGQMSGYVYDDASMTSRTASWGGPDIWMIGYDPERWSMVPDSQTLTTLIRGGNYDYLTNSAHWENIPQQTLPASFYLSAKPAFFGATPFPPIGPDVAGLVNDIPAKYCYEHGQRMPDCVANPPETVPPTVFISTPADAATIAGVVVVGGTAADNAALAGVSVRVDNGAYAAASGAANWTFSLDTRLLANGAHAITAKATDSAGNVSTAAVNVAVNNPPDVSSPTVPAALSAAAAANARIDLAWTVSYDTVGVAGYNVWRCPGSGCSPSVKIATTAANAYADTGLSVGQSYTYAVSAFDAAGNVSLRSSTAAATTPDTFTLGETSVLAGDDSGNGGLLLAQSAALARAGTLQSLSFYVATAAGSLRLGVYDAAGPGGGPGAKMAETNAFTPVVGWNTASVLAPAALTPGTYWLAYLPSSSGLAFKSDPASGAFKYYAQAFGPLPASFSTTPSGGTTHWSFYATLAAPSVDVSSPTAPSAFAASGVSSTTFALSWTASTDDVAVAGYRLDLSTAASFAPALAGYGNKDLGNVSSAALAGLSASTTYYARLRAYDAAGNVSAAAVVSTATAPSPAAAAVRDIRADFGAVCDGAADDGAAFAAFNAWALNWQKSGAGLIELDIPAGAVCIVGGAATRWTNGLKRLLVVGYGATLKAPSGGGFFLGGLGILQNPHSARTATARAGATSVTLLSPSQASLFTVGQYAMMAGFDLMGYGYPPNPHFFQYVKVAGVDAAAGVVTFDAPLRDAYKSTWPFYWDGGVFGSDLGGPATLYALDPAWDTEVEYRGLTIEQEGQTYANGRSVTYRDVKFTLGNCAVPTTNKIWRVVNSDFSGCWIEADKLVEQVLISSTILRAIDFQSSSIDELTMDHSSVTVRVTGTPKRAFISDTYMNAFWPGVYAYGRSDEVVCTSCTMHEFLPRGVSGDVSASTMTNGVITIPNSWGPQPWAVPGTKAFFSGRFTAGPSLTILDVTQDASNIYVKTSLPGGLPPAALWYQGTSLGIHDHPAPKFTCRGCAGTPEVADLSQAPAGAALYSYSKRAYSGNFGSQGVNVWGKLVSMRINVTKPYTGSRSSLALEAMGMFGNFVANDDGSLSRLDPLVNLKAAGERVITPASTSGVQPGDNLTANADSSLPWKSWSVWLTGAGVSMPDLSAEPPSVWPAVTIELVTDQGFDSVVAPAADTTAPSAPASLAAAAVSSRAISLSWSPSTDDVGVASYLVLRDGSAIGSTTRTQFDDFGLLAAHGYSYVVKAVDAAGNLSAPSAVASTATLKVPGADLPINQGLVGRWTFDAGDIDWSDASHGVMIDAAGYNNHATLLSMSRSSSMVAGMMGGALAFDGAAARLNVPYSASLGVTGSLTISAWVRVDAAGEAVVAARWGGNNSWMLDLTRTASCAPDGLRAIGYLFGPAPWGTLCNGAIVAAGRWHLLAMTYDGSSQRMYVDGALDGSQNAAGALGNGLQDLNIGQGLKGAMDDLRVYNRALSAQEISQLWAMRGDAVPPSAPSNLAVSNAAPGSVDLTWTPSADNVGVAGYRLDVSSSSAFTPPLAGYGDKDLGAASRATIAGFASNQTYFIRLRAYDAAGNVSADSPVLQFFAPQGTPSPAITSALTASGNVGQPFSYQITASNGAIVFGASGLPGGLSVDTGTGLISGRPTAAGSFSVALAASNAAGSGSATLALTIGGPIDVSSPTTPTALSAVVVSTSQIRLSWTASTDDVGVLGYRVSRDGVAVATVAATTFLDAGLSPGTSYAYAVAAFDAAGRASTAAIVSAATPAADVAPPSVSILTPASGADVSGLVTISATAADNVGVASVQLRLDGVDLGPALRAPPYSYAWDTTKAANALHALTAVARDAAGNAATSASAGVRVRNRRTKVRLARSSSTPLTAAVAAAGPVSVKPDMATLSVWVDTTAEPGFPLNASLSAAIDLPSGPRTLALLRVASGVAAYAATLSSSAFTPLDFQRVDGATFTVTVGASSFDAVGENMLDVSLGGIVLEDNGPAFAVVPPGGMTQAARVSIQPEPADDGRRAAALKRQDLRAAGAGREFSVSAGTMTSAMIALPFDRTTLDATTLASQLRVAYFNPAASRWEILAGSRLGADGTLQAPVTHFSLYAPVIVLPSSTAGLRDSYAYPNPAVGGVEPTIRASLGVVDSVEVTIFDAAGRLVHSGSATGAPSGIAGGEYYYDYTWTGRKASGVYYAVIHGKKADGTTVRARAKLAVVR